MEKILCVLLVLCSIVICLFPCVKSGGNEVGMDQMVEYVFADSSEASTYVTQKYANMGFTGISKTVSCDVSLDSQNYSQRNLINNYNKTNGTLEDISDKAGGICWCSVAVSILQYYGAEKDVNQLARETIDYADNEKLIAHSVDTTIPFPKFRDLLNYEFNKNSIKKNGTVTYKDVFKTLKTNVDNGDVVAFKIPYHIMTGCGYVEYSVSYKKKKFASDIIYFFNQNENNKYKSCTAKEKFITVNDTWKENQNQYAYFPEDLIDNGTFNNKQNFGIIKFND